MKQAILLAEVSDERFEYSKNEVKDEYELLRSLDDVENTDKVEAMVGWAQELEEAITSCEWNNLKWVHVLSAGVDQAPFNLLKERNIILTASNGIHARPITESVFGALLAHVRGLYTAYDRQRVKYWNKPKNLSQIEGKTLMILGTGNIGKQLARVAKAFDMTVIGVNRSGQKVDNMDIQYVQSEAIIHVNEADIVINVLPLTEETKDFYNKDFFNGMSDGTIFINVGRGPSVNEADLLDALNTDKISHAILDVFQVEPLTEDSPFWTHDKVTVLSHETASFENYYRSAFNIFVENAKEIEKSGEPTINVKDLNTGY